MSIVAVGLNHKSAPVEIRERAAVSREEKQDACAALLDRKAATEVVVLSTCNRTEIFLYAEDPDAAEAAGRLFFEERLACLGRATCSRSCTPSGARPPRGTCSR